MENSTLKLRRFKIENGFSTNKLILKIQSENEQ